MRSLGTTRQPIQFGIFKVDTSARELRKSGRKIKLQNQAFEVLTFLLRDPGTLVTREELRKALWADDTFVDFEHGLNRIISKLREALGDPATKPKYIETIARHGYRFIGKIQAAEVAEPLYIDPKTRIAVLPFINLSGDPVHEFLADGVTEEMIAQLGQLQPQRLGVIARTSVMHFKSENKSVDQIGRELQVDYILEGSVRSSGNRVRITTQLIRVADQTQLWVETYECEVKDLLTVQIEVASRVRRSLTSTLFLSEPVERPRTSPLDSAAYDSYIRGRYFWSRRHEGGLKKAVECFKRAVEQDAEFALAYSGLADSYALLSWYGEVTAREAGPSALAAASKAVQLDDQCGEGYASLALNRFWYEWDWQGAEAAFLRALELLPSYATAHQWFASYLIAMGRFQEASVELQHALDLDPLSLIIVQSIGDPFFYAGRYDEAIIHYRKTLDLNAEFAPAYFSLGRAYEQKGLYKEAIGAYEKANAISGKMEATPAIAHALALLGARAEASHILDELIGHSQERYISSLALAVIHLGLTQYSEAVDLLEKALRERSPWLAYLKVEPIYNPVRLNAKFKKILRKLALDTPHTVAA
jgi:TolB-like protein/tetratricopeptide (TPR) repeat protein